MLAAMPLANNFFNANGDGLNMGVRSVAADAQNRRSTFYNETLIGNDPYSNRKQFNIKIDHNYQKAPHQRKLEHSNGRQRRSARRVAQRSCAGSPTAGRRSSTVGVTSTLSPTLLNEARFGYHINKGSQIPPWQMQR